MRKKPGRGQGKIWIDVTTCSPKDIAVANDLLTAISDALANKYVDFRKCSGPGC
jgi:hypothetical protein